MTFDELIFPVPRSMFLGCLLGQRLVVLRGRSGRYNELLSWSGVNAMLEHTRVGSERIRVVRRGRFVADQDFSAPRSTLDKRDGCIDGDALATLMRAGATLVINHVDELWPSIRELAESCEEIFRIHVGTNLYCSLRTDNGFNVHWDRHDVVVLQLAGAKRWRIYGPTLANAADGADVPMPDEAHYLWEGILEDGDWLYMPRGWWHVAFPIDEPCLHATISLRHPTGADLCRWLFKELRLDPLLRADLPHLKSLGDRRRYAELLRNLVVNRAHGELVDEYMDAMDAVGPVRPRVRLPYAGHTQASYDPDTPLRLRFSRRLHPRRLTETAEIEFVAGGHSWRCRASFAPALAQLHNLYPTTVRFMRDLIPTKDSAHFAAFITALIVAGVLVSEPHAAR